MELTQFLEKLQKVLDSRKDLFVIARTDASDEEEIFKRAKSFAAIGVDAVLVDGLNNIQLLSDLGCAP